MPTPNITGPMIAAAAALAAGLPENVAFGGLSDDAKTVAASKPLRGISLHGILAKVAAARGIPFSHGGVGNDVLAAIFRSERYAGIQADGGGAGGFSTMTLSGILENVQNKAMLAAYGNVPSVVADIAFETDTNDFKPFKRYRLTAAGGMAPVGPTGELKSYGLQDESYANQVRTAGMILTVTREMFINDDMVALLQMPSLIGRESALYREQLVISTLLTAPTTPAPGASIGQPANPYTFFSTAAGNLMTGPTSALAINSVTTASQKFMEQVDANGRPIAVMPDRMLVPPALWGTAQEVFKGTTTIVTALAATAGGSVAPNLNVHAGSFRPITSPFLANRGGKGLPGSNDSGWYLLTNPAGGFATVQVGYLRGQRTPIVESGEPNFNTLGLSMRAVYDLGVALHDSRCGLYATGQ